MTSARSSSISLRISVIPIAACTLVVTLVVTLAVIPIAACTLVVTLAVIAVMFIVSVLRASSRSAAASSAATSSVSAFLAAASIAAASRASACTSAAFLSASFSAAAAFLAASHSASAFKLAAAFFPSAISASICACSASIRACSASIFAILCASRISRTALAVSLCTFVRSFIISLSIATISSNSLLSRYSVVYTSRVSIRSAWIERSHLLCWRSVDSAAFFAVLMFQFSSASCSVSTFLRIAEIVSFAISLRSLAFLMIAVMFIFSVLCAVSAASPCC